MLMENAAIQTGSQERVVWSSGFERIDFTKSGWRQFAKLNRALGTRFIRAFVLKQELAAFIVAHEQAGCHLDADCQEVRYEDGVYLLLRKVQGVWYITDVMLTEPPESFSPVLFWTQVKRGVSYLLRQVVVGWCSLAGKQVMNP